LLKKIVIIGPVALGVIVYLFAMWNASRALWQVEQMSKESSAAMAAYDEWTWERPWALERPGDCRSASTLVEEAGRSESGADLALLRDALVSGRALPVGNDGSEAEVAHAAAAAASCRFAGAEDRMSLDGVSAFDWNAHLAVVTRLAVDGARAAPDRCLESASRVAELAHDASVGGALGALSYATVELELATALVERCVPAATDAALEDVSYLLSRIVTQDVPFWRALYAESLLVELGARNAADDIRRVPTDPLELKDAVFNGAILRTWRRARQAREALEPTAEAQGPVEAAVFWESVFEDPDDEYEHALAPQPVEHIRRFAEARERLDRARRELEHERARRIYRSYLENSVQRAFEQRYVIAHGDH
jgi:hypothetical protein